MVNDHKPVLDFLCKSLGTEFIRAYSDEDIKRNPGFFIEIFKAQICLKKASIYNVTDHSVSRDIQIEIEKLQEYCTLLQDLELPKLGKENKQVKEERKPITADMVKALREVSGISMMECKKALTYANGDSKLALNYLRKTNYARI